VACLTWRVRAELLPLPPLPLLAISSALVKSLILPPYSDTMEGSMKRSRTPAVSGRGSERGLRRQCRRPGNGFRFQSCYEPTRQTAGSGTAVGKIGARLSQSSWRTCKASQKARQGFAKGEAVSEGLSRDPLLQPHGRLWSNSEASRCTGCLAASAAVKHHWALRRSSNERCCNLGGNGEV